MQGGASKSIGEVAPDDHWRRMSVLYMAGRTASRMKTRMRFNSGVITSVVLAKGSELPPRSIGITGLRTSPADGDPSLPRHSVPRTGVADMLEEPRKDD